jgi:AI-2 transport system permease protein
MNILKWIKSWEMSLVGLLVLEIFIVGTVTPSFLNLENLLYSTSDFMHIILIALPLTFVIITGGIDVSIVSIMGLSSITLGLSWVMGADIFVALGIALAVGGLAGLFNGILVANTDIPPMVITLGTLFMYAGIATGLPGMLEVLGFNAYGATGFSAYLYEGITGLPKNFTHIAHGSIGWVPYPFIYILILTVLLSFVLYRTRFGRSLYLIGVNVEAARFSGINVKQTIITAYVLSGLGASFAGVMLTSYFTSARSDLGSEALLPTITAVVLGGTSILGGSGSVIGTLLAGLFVGFLRQGLLAMGVTSDVVPIAIGILLVLALVFKMAILAFNQYRINRHALASKVILKGGEADLK